MKTRYNCLVTTPLYLSIQLNGNYKNRIPDNVYYDNDAAIEYLYTNIIPHFIELYKDDNLFMEFVGRVGLTEEFDSYDEIDFIVYKVSFLDLCWKETLSHTKNIWSFDDKDFLIDNILRYQMKLSDEAMFLWKEEAKNKISFTNN